MTSIWAYATLLRGVCRFRVARPPVLSGKDEVMGNGLRSRLSPSLVISVIALIVAIGGTATAALKGKDKQTVRKIADQEITALAGGLSVSHASTAGTANTAAPGGAASGDLTGTYPSPSIAAGAVTPGKFGTIPAVRVRNSSAISISNDNPTALTFDTSVYDNSGMHSTATNTTRLTAPIAGIYDITGSISWAFGTGERQALIVRNGTDTLVRDIREAAGGSFNTNQGLSTQINLSAGGYVELLAFQNSGGSLNVDNGFESPVFAMHWVGP